MATVKQVDMFSSLKGFGTGASSLNCTAKQAELQERHPALHHVHPLWSVVSEGG